MNSVSTLTALVNLKEQGNTDLRSTYIGRNRINSVGLALEYFLKDMYCRTFSIGDLAIKEREYQKSFSWLGNPNNPPDFIIQQSDAVEVKKIQSPSSTIALNSSYPKAYLFNNDTRITRDCKSCEDGIGGWQKKDILYVIGYVAGQRVKRLWMVYGDCYAAEKGVYERVANAINTGLASLQNVQLSPTNELGRVNRVDPLGITQLRIRGMWQIENPHKVFSYIAGDDGLYCLMTKEKYIGLKREAVGDVISKIQQYYTVEEVSIKNPNNPAINIDSVLIKGGL
jgi:hypothetical protein